jgi:hypothetical protein
MRNAVLLPLIVCLLILNAGFCQNSAGSPIPRPVAHPINPKAPTSTAASLSTNATVSQFSFPGAYDALIGNSGSPSFDSSGFLRLSAISTGAFSAVIAFGDRPYRVAGQFDGNGNASVQNRFGERTLNLRLSITSVSGDLLLTGTISDGIETGSISGGAETNSGAATLAGRYTLLLSATDSSIPATTPHGAGYGWMDVTSDGRIKVTCVMADGSVATQTTHLLDGGGCVFFAPCGTRGALAGVIYFASTSATDCHGGAAWIKPRSAKAKIDSSVFGTDLRLSGSRYTVRTPFLDVTATQGEAAFGFFGGDLAQSLSGNTTVDSTNSVSLSSNGKVLAQLRVDPVTGRVSGTFTPPGGSPTTFGGVVFQTDNFVAGLFAGPAHAGTFELKPGDAAQFSGGVTQNGGGTSGGTLNLGINQGGGGSASTIAVNPGGGTSSTGGTLTTGGTLNLGGGTTLSSGVTLSMGGSGATVSAGGSLTLAGGPNTGSGAVIVSIPSGRSTSAILNSGTFNGTVGSVGLVTAGTGNLTLAGTGSTSSGALTITQLTNAGTSTSNIIDSGSSLSLVRPIVPIVPIGTTLINGTNGSLSSGITIFAGATWGIPAAASFPATEQFTFKGSDPDVVITGADLNTRVTDTRAQGLTSFTINGATIQLLP